MKTVRAKQNKDITLPCFEMENGMEIMVSIHQDQLWTEIRKGRYWILIRKATGYKIRLTDTAMSQFFEEVSQ